MSISLDQAVSREDDILEQPATSTQVNVFSTAVVDSLLDKLASDDSFRMLFQTNPRAALGLVGHVTPESLRDVKGSDPVLCCYNMRGLATKGAIQEGRERLKAVLCTTLPQAMFDFCG